MSTKKTKPLANKGVSYLELKKLIEEDEANGVKALLESRGVNGKIKALAESEEPIFTPRLLSFIVDREPENYVRERSGRGNHFYNPKGEIMKEYKNYLLHQMDKDDYDYTRALLANPEKTYYVKLSATYYLPIPVGDSKYKQALKAANIIMPDIHKDLDNFDKFLIDSLHDVVYDDDKRLVYISSSKKYSTHPRTEIAITILEMRENKI